MNRKDFLKASSFASLVTLSGDLFASALTITSVGGTSDHSGVANGKWTGQPDRAPSHGKYLNYQVMPVADNSLGVDTGKNYDWIISGSNFASAPGSAWLLDSGQKVVASVQIVSWSNTKIVARVNAPLSFTSNSDSSLWVSNGSAKPPPASSPNWSLIHLPVINIIQTRGYGQCTWYAAQRRLAANKHIPPGAYSTTAVVSSVGQYSNGYVPQQWDVLAYNTSHVAIISGAPSLTAAKDGSQIYTFLVSEMNADWGETERSSTKTFKLSAPNKSGQRIVQDGIHTLASKTWVASGYYR